MSKEIIGRGAEAVIRLQENTVLKERISKSYRLPELDKKIIKRRTKAETKTMLKASEIINVPKPEEQKKENTIKMPFIEGEKLSEFLDSYEQDKQEEIMFQLGKSIAKLHKEGIIHGDLTTSNMIYIEEKTNFEKQLDELRNLNLPKKEFVIMGSGPIAIRKIRDSEDVDLFVTKKLWYKLKKEYKIKKVKFKEKEIEVIKIENIEIIRDWEQSEKEIINHIETVGEFQFLTLKKTIEIKKKFGRKKDLEDIKLIKEYLKDNKNANEVSQSRAGGRESSPSGKVFLIDFGLAFQNGKYEDKGVDLHLLKQALEAKHFRNWETLFKEFEVGYRSIESKEAQKVFDRMKSIEKRGRYRH